MYSWFNELTRWAHHVQKHRCFGSKSIERFHWYMPPYLHNNHPINDPPYFIDNWYFRFENLQILLKTSAILHFLKYNSCFRLWKRCIQWWEDNTTPLCATTGATSELSFTMYTSETLYIWIEVWSRCFLPLAGQSLWQVNRHVSSQHSTGVTSSLH